MEQLLKWKSISAILLIAMCSYSANAKADMQGKKKNKVAQQQTVKEDYGNTVTLVKVRLNHIGFFGVNF